MRTKPESLVENITNSINRDKAAGEYVSVYSTKESDETIDKAINILTNINPNIVQVNIDNYRYYGWKNIIVILIT